MTEIAAHEYEPVATLMGQGKTLEEALAIVRKTKVPAASTQRPQPLLGPKPTARGNKYGAVHAKADDILFDSRAEMRRYQHLKLQEDLGVISDLELQPVFTLHAPTPAGELKFIGRYTADFAYRVVATGEIVTEEVKGGDATKTQIYRWKRKHTEYEYGITITEVQ